jgi:hypothetical protein
MSRLFRQPTSGPSGYVALILFMAAYLGVLCIAVVPQEALTSFGLVATESVSQ